MNTPTHPEPQQNGHSPSQNGETHTESSHLEVTSGTVPLSKGSQLAESPSADEASAGKGDQERAFGHSDAKAWGTMLLKQRVILRLEIISKREVKVCACLLRWCARQA